MNSGTLQLTILPQNYTVYCPSYDIAVPGFIMVYNSSELPLNKAQNMDI
jgi:hypothetical protein